MNPQPGAPLTCRPAPPRPSTQVFGQPHYWSVDVGPLTLIGLSTTRFRSNPDSVHEVHVCEEQLEFLKKALAAAGDRPVAIFTHAPIMGSGLKVRTRVLIWVLETAARLSG
jgi:hypothetical protein